MAKLMGILQGNRGAVTRLSGSRLRVDANGWNTGCEVLAEVLSTGQVSISVYRTGGSLVNDSSAKVFVAGWIEDKRISRKDGQFPDTLKE